MQLAKKPKMIEIIEDKKEWESELTSMPYYDFYHTYDYHHLSKTEAEKPLLLKYTSHNSTILLPILLRPIFDTPYFDITSVYGYAGPLCKNFDDGFGNLGFKQAFENYCKQQNIVSVFARLNPYIPNQQITINGLGEVLPIGNVVNIDLTLDLDAQRAKYRRDTKSRVNKARRECHVRKAETHEDVLAYIDIYRETMTKLEADTSYFFSNEYFFNFLKSTGFETEILLAVHNETNEITAGSMFVKTNNIVQYHLSGTKSTYFHLAPARLLLDEMRIKATGEGYRFFNLGGGYQSKEDALFDFKASFSDDIKTFSVWRYVVNKDIYDSLKAEKNIKNTNYFPAYRASI